MAVKIIIGDCREKLRDLAEKSVHCLITSPPYWSLRDYQVEPSIWGGISYCVHEWGPYEPINNTSGLHRMPLNRTGGAKDYSSVADNRGAYCQICHAWRGVFGLEPTFELYIENSVEIFREVRRVLRDDGVIWINLGDSYAGGGRGGNPEESSFRKQATNVGSVTGVTKNKWPLSGLKPKDMACIPWRVAIALQADGWYLRSALPWLKINAMPESATDRPVSAIEYFFLLSKSGRYYYDHVAVKRAMQEISLQRLSQPNVFNQEGGEKDTKEGNRSHRKAINNQAERLVKHEKWKTRFEGWDEYDKTLGRNFRNTDLFFDSLERPHGAIADAEGELLALDIPTQPYKEAHFATFGASLIEPLIKASTSEYGCCAFCGSPWERMSSDEFIPQEDVSGDKGIRAHPGQKPMDESSGWPGTPRGHTIHKTQGWRPTCKCDSSDVRPCTVLDPFGGSGTVGLVCDRLQRDAVLIELNSEYAEMASRRINGDSPLFSNVSSIKDAQHASKD